MNAVNAGSATLIESATYGAGHDGRAELVVTLRHPGGGSSTLSLAEEMIAETLDRAGITSITDLPGRTWPDLAEPDHSTAREDAHARSADS